MKIAIIYWCSLNAPEAFKLNEIYSIDGCNLLIQIKFVAIKFIELQSHKEHNFLR